MRYQQQRDRRREALDIGHKTKAGVLHPAMFHTVRENEGGVLHQSLNFILDPIPGRLMTNIRAQVQCIYVPLQAMHELLNPLAQYPGSDDVIKTELASGNVIIPLEDETQLSKRFKVVPVSIAGVRKVSAAARLAYIAAANMLRRRRFVKAQLLDSTCVTLTPGILDQTILERLGAVLDPEDRVNGAVDLTAKLPVKGIGYDGGPTVVDGLVMRETGATANRTVRGAEYGEGGPADRLRMEEDPDNPGFPGIYAHLGTQVSLSDMFQAEKMDELVRRMRQYVNDNPEKGEEIVMRWAAGLSLDVGRYPFVLYERTVTLTDNVARPMDGAQMDNVRTYGAGGLDFSVTVPRTELGGCIVTLVTIKPDEVLAEQPNPLGTRPWSAINYVADEMAVDPVPVTMRDLYADVATGDEDVVALYMANNGILMDYQLAGWNDEVNPVDVANENAIWQLAIPMSVTPQNVLYPSPLPQTPFADTTAEVCTFKCTSRLELRTPIIVGPSPVEELAVIEDEGVFDDI